MAEGYTPCEQCRRYAPLQDPFHYECNGYPEGVTVYGFCTKDIGRLRSFYPVYIPDSGSTCDDYLQKPHIKKTIEPVNGQLYMKEV